MKLTILKFSNPEVFQLIAGRVSAERNQSIMSTALATLTSTMARRFDLGDDGGELLSTLKQTAFKGQVSDAQMMALLVVANQYGLNPWTKEIYAFPDRQNGIVPVVGVDGWSRIINNHPQFDGMEFEETDESCTCKIYRKDRSRPVSVTEYKSECFRDIAGPWKTHPKRMLRHKSMIQCSRIAFGFGGIFDHDEAERIAEIEINPAPARRQTGKQAAEAAKQQADAEVDAAARAEMVARLEKIAEEEGEVAYADAFADLGKEGRLTVGADEHKRLKSIAAETTLAIRDLDAKLAAEEAQKGGGDE